MTADGIDHGKHILADCFEAVIEKYEDGYTLCPILWSGGKCEECLEVFERRSGWMTKCIGNYLKNNTHTTL